MADTTVLVNTVLAEIIQSAVAVKQFVVTETPLVINELISWKIFENGFDILIGLVTPAVAK